MIALFQRIATAGLLLAAATDAYAASSCPSGEPILSTLTCSSSTTGTMSGTGTSYLGGTTSSTWYTCGSPYAPLAQLDAEDVYSFECQVTGTVTLDITGMTCDFDIYILDDTCNASTGCVTGSTKAGTKADSLSFSCTAGKTYYVVIEGFGYTGTSPGGKCSGSESYTLDFDLSASTACNEDCDDGVDNDLDGKTDCADSDCASDPVCLTCDADGDGYDSTSCTGGTDCNDASASVHPGATETCNSVDDDCDGSVDEGLSSTWYKDADGDGYGLSSSTTTSCSKPSGYVSTSGDCDDSNKSINPGATETCNSKDDDCDGSIDEGLSSTWYKDADGDGYGVSTTTTSSCSKPSGYVSTSGDCDDTSAKIYPGATETCNSKDDDCDGSVDEGLTSTYYKDADGDGYGSTTTTTGCSAPSGYTATSGDCDDSKKTVYPGAPEICDSIDNDCDGSIDEGATVTTWYKDGDGDGYGDPSTTTSSCSAPTGYVTTSGDCKDSDATVHPGATESPYDGIDQDCDGSDLTDVDGDGYASTAVSGGTDCADGDSSVYPGATENPDGVDEDCDGTVDEGTSWYDDDGDGFTEDGGDCDDASATASPGDVETCNGKDDDCDGTIDEGTSCYDDDGDGYTEDSGDCNDGDGTAYPGATEIDGNGVDDDCDGVVDSDVPDGDRDGYIGKAGDCDDGDDTVYPGAPEVIDGLDNDCDGLVDEGTRAYDDDGDGQTELEGDCDDADASIYEGATEDGLNGVDDDCDGKVDEGGARYDDDGDGWTEEGGDCDDANADAHPGASEGDAANGADDDCDGVVDDLADDLDADGYSPAQGDCDDHDGWRNPGEDEVCDHLDNDCDGEVDNGCDDTGTITSKSGDCGCSTADVGMAGLYPALLLLAVARRRRSPTP